MTRQVSTRFFVLIGLVTAGLAGAVVGRRPELAAATAPFLALLLVGCGAHRWPDVTVVTRPERGRAIEGDTIELLVDVTASRPVPWLDLELALPPSLEPVDGSDRALVTVPEAGTRTVAFPVRARRWGVASPERTLVVARDRFGLFTRSRVGSSHAPVRVYPAEGQLAAMLAPRSTGRSLGTHLATARGEGCEFAEVRPYRPGDRPRALNWRVSARRGEPWVTERHPELATDLVVLLDAGTEVGSVVSSPLPTSVGGCTGWPLGSAATSCTGSSTPCWSARAGWPRREEPGWPVHSPPAAPACRCAAWHRAPRSWR